MYICSILGAACKYAMQRKTNSSFEMLTNALLIIERTLIADATALVCNAAMT